MAISATIGGTAVEVAEATVETNLEGLGARCELLLVASGPVPDLPSGRQAVVVDLGYGTTLARAFTGSTDAHDRRYWPLTRRVVAIGRLALVAQPTTVRERYRNLTDIAIIEDLLQKAGLATNQYSVSGEGRTLGTVVPVEIAQGITPLQMIRRLDRLTNCITYDTPSGVVTRRLWPLSGGGAALLSYTFVDGVPASGQYPILEIEREESIAGVINRVKVLGHLYEQPDDVYWNRPHAVWRSASAVVSDPPGYLTETIEDDWIETTAHADHLAHEWLIRLSAVPGRVAFTTVGLPDLHAGQVVGVRHATLGLSSVTPAVVLQARHEWSTRALTRVVAQVGIGAADEAEDPLPNGTVALTSPSYSGTNTTVTAVVDGITKTDSAGPFTIRWYTSVNPASLEGLDETSFQVTFTAREFADGPSIFCEIEDPADRLRRRLEKRLGGGLRQVV